MTESQNEPSDFIRNFSHFGRLIDPSNMFIKTVMNTFHVGRPLRLAISLDSSRSVFSLTFLDRAFWTPVIPVQMNGHVVTQALQRSVQSQSRD